MATTGTWFGVPGNYSPYYTDPNTGETQYIGHLANQYASNADIIASTLPKAQQDIGTTLSRDPYRDEATTPSTFSDQISAVAGGRWTLRDIVDYELIATMGLLEAAADRRETLLRQIYEVNRRTVEAGRVGDVAAILIPLAGQHDPREAVHLVERLRMGGVELSRAGAEFEAEGTKYAAGTFVIPMTQVFARYAKDLLEKQTYPEVRRSPTSPPEPPYDVTAWSLGMQLGVKTVLLGKPVPDAAKLSAVCEVGRLAVPPEPQPFVLVENREVVFV